MMTAPDAHLRILEAVGHGAEELLRSKDLSEGTGRLLRLLGQAAECSRTYLFENRVDPAGELTASLLSEWTGEGCAPHGLTASHQGIQYLPAFRRWMEQLGQGHEIAGDVGSFPDSERPGLLRSNVVSLLVVPVAVERRWWGFIGFDECRVERRWSPSEVAGLKLAAHLLGAAIGHRTADLARRETEERFRSLVEHALIGLYRTTPDGKVLMANKAMIRLLGFDTLEELQQAHLDDLARGQRYQRERFRELIQRDGVVSGFESDWTLDGGHVVHLRENARAVTDERGRVLYYEGTVEDLTAQRALEDQLRHAQRMDTVGRLAGGIAHDFNNLLQAVLGNTQLLRLELPDAEAYAETFDELESLAGRGRVLTRQLLLFSHRDIARPRKLDLNQLVRESSSFLRRLVRANVRLAVETADEEYVIDADPGQLEQVLANLVVNSVDAMPQGGELLIRTAMAGEGFILEVVDQGSGIPEELQQRVFEPFFSTKDPAGGAGLGLSVVHGIVTRHGGRIELSSVVGRGTTMRIHLPRHDSGVFDAVPEVAASDLAHAPRRYRVLVVEDNGTVRNLFGRMLEGLGYTTRLAHSAEEALALPEDEPFDALLTDFMLPGASGVELAAALRRRWPKLAALLASGYAEGESIRSEALPEGMRILPKPVDLQVLADALRAAVQERLPARSSGPAID